MAREPRQESLRLRKPYKKRPGIGAAVVVQTAGRWGEGVVIAHLQHEANGRNAEAGAIVVQVRQWANGQPPTPPPTDEQMLAFVAQRFASIAPARPRRRRPSTTPPPRRRRARRTNASTTLLTPPDERAAS